MNTIGNVIDRGGVENIVDLIYPVGSIYLSVNSVNPSTLFGGTWVAWGSGKVPVGVDTNDTDFDTVEETGGSKSHTYTPQGSNGNVGATTLTAAQSGVPAHSHGLNNHKHSVGAHNHGLNGHTHSFSGTTGDNLIALGYGGSTSQGTATISDSAFLTNRAASSGQRSTMSQSSHSHSYSGTTGGASGNTADSTAFDTGAATGNTANNTAANATQSHTHSGSTFTGVESTQSHLQPYITCYMWKRTA